MKKLSEIEAEEAEAKRAAEEEQRRRDERLKKLAEDTRAYVDAIDVAVTNAKMAPRIKAHLLAGHGHLVELACDECGTALVDMYPGQVNDADPAQYGVGCPGCGWVGWAPAEHRKVWMNPRHED